MEGNTGHASIHAFKDPSIRFQGEYKISPTVKSSSIIIYLQAAFVSFSGGVEISPHEMYH